MDRHRLPPLTSLRAFEAVARHQSVSRAADELHVTHAAISHQIRSLELWFGYPLLEKKGRGVTPTATGDALGLHLTKLFDDLTRSCVQLRSGDRCTISIGCIPSVASCWLVPKISEFSARYPKVEPQVRYARPHELLADGRYDVLITCGKDLNSGVTSVEIFSSKLQPVCSPKYISHHGTLVSPVNIEHAQLLHDETRDGWVKWFDAVGHRASLPLAGPIFQDFDMLATAVLAGHGVALCPVQVFQEQINRGELILLSDVSVVLDDGYFMTTPRAMREEVGLFVRWFLSAVQCNSDDAD